MHLETLDIIFLVIISFFVIRGIFKGLIRQAFNLVSFFVSIVGAVFLTSPVSKFLYKSQFASNLNNKVGVWLVNKNAFFSENIIHVNDEFYSRAVESIPLPKFLSKIIANNLLSNNFEGQQVYTILSPYITKLLIIIGAFILIFIITLIILKILGRIFSTTINDSFLGLFNKLLGGLFGLIKAMVIIYLFIGLVLLVGKIPFLKTMIDDLLSKHLNSEEFCITKFLIERNFFKIIFKRM